MNNENFNNMNNNIIGYDSQTGQPIYANQNINMQQPVQPQPTKKSNNKIVIIVVILAIIAIISGLLYLNNQKNNNQNNVNNNNNLETEIDNTINNSNETDITDTELNQDNEEDTEVVYDKEGDFLFSVEDIFTVTGRGTIVTGKIDRGTVKLGDIVQLIGLDKEIITTEIAGIQAYNEEFEEAAAGQEVGLLLKEILREDVERGQVLAKPNSISATKKFDAEIKMLSKEEGGRHTPFFENFKPYFEFRTIDIIGTFDFPEGIEMVSPGDKVTLTITLDSSVAMEIGTEFLIKGNNFNIIGKGIVTKIY